MESSSASPSPIHTYAVEWAKEEGLTNCSSIYRNPHSPQTLVTKYNCQGDRNPVYEWISFAEYRRLVYKAAKLLEKIHIATGENKFVVMAATLSKEWLLMDLALMRICGISVPFYGL